MGHFPNEEARLCVEGARGGHLVHAHALHLAAAATALAGGEAPLAQQEARQGLEALSRARFGASEADREQLEDVLVRAQALERPDESPRPPATG